MENLNYKNENIVRIYLKVKNNFLELEKRFYRIELYKIKRYNSKMKRYRSYR